MVPELMASAAAQVTGDTRSEAQRRYREFVLQYRGDDALLESERDWDRDTANQLPGSGHWLCWSGNMYLPCSWKLRVRTVR